MSDNYGKIKDFIYSRHEELVKNLAELVALPSYSGSHEAGPPFGASTK